MAALEETHVVTCFLRSEGEVLLLRRSEDVGSYAGAWGTVSGHVEGDEDGTARREIAEETGIDDAELVRRGKPFPVVDEGLGKRWIVHPFLFDTARCEPVLNYESTRAEWTSPTAILHLRSVPRLWDSYRAVAPTIDAVRSDRRNGSTYLSLRALEVLRDRAAEGACSEDLRETATELIAAQPSMAAVRNRINRAMHRSKIAATNAAGVVHHVLREAVGSDRAAAEEAGRLLAEVTVLTLSRSETVMSALLAARPRVLVAASHPGNEGIAVARALAQEGIEVTLLADAALASAPAFALVLLGCDTVLPDGSVVNKVGSHVAALVAQSRSVPVYVATSVDKLSVRGNPVKSRTDRTAFGDLPDGVDIHAELFEVVPADLIDAFATEEGLLSPGGVANYAESFRALETW